MVERSPEGRRQKTIVCPTFGTARNVETPGAAVSAYGLAGLLAYCRVDAAIRCNNSRLPGSLAFLESNLPYAARREVKTRYLSRVVALELEL